jgi:hypothetical protein
LQLFTADWGSCGEYADTITVNQFSDGGAPMDEEKRRDEETRSDEWFDVMREWFED